MSDAQQHGIYICKNIVVERSALLLSGSGTLRLARLPLIVFLFPSGCDQLIVIPSFLYLEELAMMLQRTSAAEVGLEFLETHFPAL